VPQGMAAMWLEALACKHVLNKLWWSNARWAPAALMDDLPGWMLVFPFR
jgi:hypothetical protein